jgi:hypothetical protein
MPSMIHIYQYIPPYVMNHEFVNGWVTHWVYLRVKIGGFGNTIGFEDLNSRRQRNSN